MSARPLGAQSVAARWLQLRKWLPRALVERCAPRPPGLDPPTSPPVTPALASPSRVRVSAQVRPRTAHARGGRLLLREGQGRGADPRIPPPEIPGRQPRKSAPDPSDPLAHPLRAPAQARVAFAAALRNFGCTDEEIHLACRVAVRAVRAPPPPDPSVAPIHALSSFLPLLQSGAGGLRTTLARSPPPAFRSACEGHRRGGTARPQRQRRARQPRRRRQRCRRRR